MKSSCMDLWCYIPPKRMTDTVELKSSGIPLDGTPCPGDKARICIQGECFEKPIDL